MLDVDPTREGAFEITDQVLEGQWALPRISAKNIQELLRFLAKPAARDFSGVLLRLPGENDPPGSRSLYQPGFSDVLLSGVRSPLRIDSRIPGIARRYSVS